MSIKDVSTLDLLKELRVRGYYDENITTFDIPGYFENTLTVGNGEYMTIPSKMNTIAKVVVYREFAKGETS